MALELDNFNVLQLSKYTEISRIGDIIFYDDVDGLQDGRLGKGKRVCQDCDAWWCLDGGLRRESVPISEAETWKDGAR